MILDCESHHPQYHQQQELILININIGGAYQPLALGAQRRRHLLSDPYG